MMIEEIVDDDELYRRFPSKMWLKENGKLSSAAFHNTSDTDDMSVDLARLSSPPITALDHSNGVAVFTAGFARSLTQRVYHSPQPDNKAHSTVEGKKTKSISRKFANKAKIILYPGWSR